MKVLVAPDKFKGSLTAAQVADHIAAGLEDEPAIRCTRLPLADGGDGSVAAAVAAGYQPHTVTVVGPTGRPHQATIAFDGSTAVVEVANTCGIALLPGRAAANRWRRPASVSARPSAPPSPCTRRRSCSPSAARPAPTAAWAC